MCDFGKAEYIMKVKNISDVGEYNMKNPVRVCGKCYRERNPEGLKRTEISGERLCSMFMQSFNDPKSIIHRDIRKMSTEEPTKVGKMVSLMNHTISDGLIIHWKKIRK